MLPWLAGNSAAANSDGLIYDVMAAIYTACASFMSQNLGAGKQDRVLKSYLISLLYSFGIGGAMGLLLVIFGRQFYLCLLLIQMLLLPVLSALPLWAFLMVYLHLWTVRSQLPVHLEKVLFPCLSLLWDPVFSVCSVYTVFAYFKTIPSLYLLYVFSWSITAVQRSSISCIFTDIYFPKNQPWHNARLVFCYSAAIIRFLPFCIPYGKRFPVTGQMRSLSMQYHVLFREHR